MGLSSFGAQHQYQTTRINNSCLINNTWFLWAYPPLTQANLSSLRSKNERINLQNHTQWCMLPRHCSKYHPTKLVSKKLKQINHLHRSPNHRKISQYKINRKQNIAVPWSIWATSWSGTPSLQTALNVSITGQTKPYPYLSTLLIRKKIISDEYKRPFPCKKLSLTAGCRRRSFIFHN